MREGLELLRPAALRLGNSAQLALLAEACLHLNRVDEGMAAIEAGLTYARESSESMFDAELWRLRGELLVRRGPRRGGAQTAAHAEASECFEQARSVARSQGARALEQRARPAPGEN
jgi:hypothetical protein